jgi:hypothetical protein
LTTSGLVDATGALVAAPTNWQPGQPGNLNDADAMEASTAADFKWAMAQVSKVQAYVIQYHASNPNSKDTDGDGVFDNEERTLKGNPNIADTDGDGLTDSEEKAAGTDLVLVDTDGDSLTDFAEVKTHNTDPLKKDTDSDALEDDDEISLGTDPRDDDTDNDNLKDGDEVSRGTNPKLKDSDSDGLDDDKEVLLHLTDPNDPDTDGDGINDGDEVSKGTNPKDDKDPKAIDTDGDNLTNFDELFVHNTDPNKADTDGDGINDDVEIANGGDPLDAESDTDGDGLKDKVETRTGIFVSSTNTGTNPYAADTDGDGLRDDKETGTGKYVSLNNTGTNPNVADTDGDGLTDKEEIDGVNGFQSNPFLIDADGDLISDFDEVNATPPTDPNDPSKYPSGSGTPFVTAGGHSFPVLVGDEQSVAIDQSYAPYGHRPDRDKVGDDGSGTVIDRNGVLIWSNKNGERVTIPNAAYAKTLHVSNTECLVYSNRFKDWNSLAHKAEITIHRRGATGGIISSTPLTIDGTVLDAASVTPTTYGYLLVSGNRIEDGKESTQITKGALGSENIQEVDKWDILELSLYSITWDGLTRSLAGGEFYIPKNAGKDFSDAGALGYGSDGSLLFNMSTAATFLDRYDDLDPGTFASKKSSIWVSATINQESIRELPRAIDALAYVDNDRLIGQRVKTGSVGVNEIVDYRQYSKGTATEISVLELPAGERVLPLAEYSMRGLSPYIYTLNAAGTSLKLYKADAAIAPVGSAVTLPLPVSNTAAFVRNPRDGSLSIKSIGGTLIWVPTTTNGTSAAIMSLGTPKAIPDSTQAKALFVTSRECVVWLNGDEPPLNGNLPAIKIANYQINGSNLIAFNLTPPIEGNYAVIPNILSLDPDLEGWHITTFEKDAPASFLQRTYRLQLAVGVDRDNDAICDYDEITGRFNGGVATDPYDADTDDDGFTDGRELLPFVAVNDSLTWEEARSAASEAGGRLVVLDGQDQQDRFAAWLAANKPSGAYWVGGHDTIQEGSFSWLDAAGGKTGSNVINPKNWAVAQPSNLYDADGMQVTSNGNYKWSMAPISTKQSYIVEFARTNPLIVNDSTEFDTDGDGVSDYQEVTFLFTDPSDPNSFATSALGGVVSYAEGRGNYESLLYHSNDGYGFKLTLNVTAKGAFSGSLEGNFGKASVRGKYMADGTWSGRITNGNAGVLNMKIAQQAGGSYAVQGFLATPTGGDYFFHARRAIGFAARKTTFEASLIGDEAGPTGSAIATGGIAKGGKVTQQIYNLNGLRATYAGSVLEGDYMALYARTNGAAPTVMLGNVALRNSPAGKSDFDGIVRLFNRNYDQERSLSGAYYTPSTMGTLPLPALRTTANNAIFSWSDGRFDGVNKVASWLPSKVTVPTTQSDRTTAKFDRKTGLLSLTHTRTDATRGLVNSKSNAFAVVVQGKDKLSGFYIGAGSSGGFSVQENSEGLLPEYTNISPLNKTVSADGMSYNVDVTTAGDWTVAIPSGSWVAANVTSGKGNGTVQITVQPNATNARRETSIKIAGYTHTITQSYR